MQVMANMKWILVGMVFLGGMAGSPAMAETYTMREGDTLWEIARVKYGDPSFYSDLQKANSISNPRAIPNGTVINLPSKATLTKLRGVTDAAERERILKGEGGTGTGGGTPGGTARPPRPAPQSFSPIQALGSQAQPPGVGGAK